MPLMDVSMMCLFKNTHVNHYDKPSSTVVFIFSKYILSIVNHPAVIYTHYSKSNVY